MKNRMKTYMHIQVAYPKIMKQNWRGGAEARVRGRVGMEDNFAILEYE